MTTYKDLPENNHFSGQRLLKENKRSSMFGLKKNSSSIRKRTNLDECIQITGFRIFLGAKRFESSNNIIYPDFSGDSSKDFPSFNMKISEPVISRVLLHTNSIGECYQEEYTKKKESENDLQTKFNVKMQSNLFNESNYTIKLKTFSYPPQTNFWGQPNKYESTCLDFNHNKENVIRTLDEKSETSSFTTSSESLSLGNISDMSSLVLSNMKTSRLSRFASIVKNIWNNVTKETNKRTGLSSQPNHGMSDKNKALSLPQRSFNDLNGTFIQNRSDIHQDLNCISTNQSNSNDPVAQPLSHNVSTGNTVSCVKVPQNLKDQTSTCVHQALAEYTSGLHVTSAESFNATMSNENMTVEVNSVPSLPSQPEVNPLNITMVENIIATKAYSKTSIQIKKNGEIESVNQGKFNTVSYIKSKMGSQDSSIRVPHNSKSVIFCSSSHRVPGNVNETLIKLCDDCYKRTKTAVKEMQRNYEQKPSMKNRNDDRPEEHLSHIPANRSVEIKDLTELPTDNLPTHVQRKFNMEDIDIISEAVNNHLLDLKPVDGDFLKDALEFLRKRWILVVSDKNSKLKKVSDYLKYFQKLSDELLEKVMLSTDREGNNAFHFACGNDRFDIVEELLNYETGHRLLKQKNKLGHSPLMVCSVSQPKSDQEWIIVKKILDLGDVNEASSLSKQTPLMNATSRGSVSMVRLLLEAGADPNLQDSDGSTALMYAAVHGHETCVSLLLEHPKCNPSIKDYDQQTACSVALAAGHKETALLIYLHSRKKKQGE